MYSRFWSAPRLGIFALMYATYYPKIIEADLSTPDSVISHRHSWTQFTVFLDTTRELEEAYACAWRKADGIIRAVPWTYCCHYEFGQRPIVTADRDFLDVYPDPRFPYTEFAVKEGTFKLAVWELLHIEEINNFNTVDWSPAKCLMQDKYFDSEMRELYQASLKFI